MKVLVLFGSESDAPVYDQLIKDLKSIPQTQVEFAVLSAHRNPDELEIKLRQGDFNLIAAGAGLAAHLPGVVASKVKVPVIGIPVSSYFKGLDAFCSIIQMPFGVPVLCVGPEKTQEAAKFVFLWNNLTSDHINLVVPSAVESLNGCDKEIARTLDYAHKQNIPLHQVANCVQGQVNIKLVHDQNDIDPSDHLCIYVPFVEEERKHDPTYLMEMMNWSNQGGVWVGCNNTRNALIMARKLI